MELNPIEAIRNNALATRLVARIAGELGVENFVLVSTDKAVKPATVMGASKALAEWAVEAAAIRSPRRGTPPSASATSSGLPGRSSRSSGVRSPPAAP